LNTGGFADPTGQPFTLNEYYHDPLNRIHKVTPPDWFTTTYSYGSNASTVSTGGTFGPATLNTTTVKDPEDIMSIMYTDKRGRSILSKTERGSDHSETYTIYDDKDRIKAMLPPGVSSTSSPLAFQYLYDGADNITKKHIPDLGWTEYLYNLRDQMTASRDPKMLSENWWLCSVYDSYGRVTATGFDNTVSAPDPNNIVIDYNLTTTTYDGGCGQIAPIYKGKVCESRSRILNGGNEWLETNFTYDDYGRVSNTVGNNHLDLTVGSDNSTLYYDWADNTTVVRRTHKDSFGATTVIKDRMTYDHSGRLENTFHELNDDPENEQLVSKNEYTVKDELAIKHLGGTGNGFLQQLDYSYRSNGLMEGFNTSPTTDDLFELHIKYNEANAALNATVQENGNISHLIWKVKGGDEQGYGFQYDYLNRLTSATYGSGTTAPVANGRYDATYVYDQRGNIEALTRKGFLTGGTYGDIDDLEYTYDPNSESNRVKSIAELITSSGKDEGFSPGQPTDYLYDENGNMEYDPSRDADISYNHLNLPELVDFGNGKTISFLYDATGTKLKKTVKDGPTTLTEQAYVNGVEYRDGTIEAIYHSEGRVTNLASGLGGLVELSGTLTADEDFAGSFISSTQVIQQGVGSKYTASTEIHMKDGFHVVAGTGKEFHAQIVPPTSPPVWRYEYSIRDHLGNTRLTFSDKNGNGTVDQTSDPATTEVLEETHYYPFGMAMKGNWAEDKGQKNRYLFNGTEFNDEFGLDVSMMAFRTYDPAIGRFWQVDPLAEAAPAWTSYRFGFNSPIIYSDALGLREEDDRSKKTEIVFEDPTSPLSANSSILSFKGMLTGDPRLIWEEAIGDYFEKQAEQKVIETFKFSKLSNTESELVKIAEEVGLESGTSEAPFGVNKDVYHENGSFLVGRWKIEYNTLIAYANRKSNYRIKDVEFGNFSFHHLGSSEPQYRIIGFSSIPAKSANDNDRRPELAFLRVSSSEIRLLRMAQSFHARSFAISIINRKYANNIEKQGQIMRVLESKGAFDY
jgi:RHS repeat-associated protein